MTITLYSGPLSLFARNEGFEDLQLAVMGCIVNGPARASIPTSASPCPTPASSATADTEADASAQPSASRSLLFPAEQCHQKLSCT
jgi:hypothetical protein